VNSLSPPYLTPPLHGCHGSPVMQRLDVAPRIQVLVAELVSLSGDR
jgi:hypothetical protein